MTREEKPYLMIKDGNFTGNDRFEGFCIDLLKGIAAQVGFQYTIKLVPDGIYGVYNPETKTWNGIGNNNALFSFISFLFCVLYNSN
jgi:glutamate receptor, ionotropic, invertebrate